MHMHIINFTIGYISLRSRGVATCTSLVGVLDNPFYTGYFRAMSLQIESNACLAVTP